MKNATKIIAHRGASRHHRENTLEAFDRAIQCGSDAVEFDVQCTADNVLITYHDDCLPNRKRQPITESTYAEVLACMARLGVYVPTLSEVLKLCKGRSFCDIDLKNSASPAEALNQIMTVLTLEQFQIKSFNSDTVLKIKELDERVSTALIVGLPSPKNAVRTRLGELFPVKRLEQCRADQIHAHYKLLRLNFLKRMSKSNIPVWIWTVDETEQLVGYLEDPLVDGVITNEPAKAVMLREEISSSEEQS